MIRVVLLRSLLALVAAFSLLEVGLRVLGPHTAWLAPFVYMPGTHTTFDDVDTLDALLRKASFNRLPLKRSNDFILNSRALRTGEYEIEKPDGTYRVVALGDSFTYASGVVPYSTMWHQELRSTLERETGRTVEMISLGVPGVGPDFEYRMWQLEGRHLRPDLLILAFFVGNDFRDIHGALGPSSGIDRVARKSLVVRAVRNATLLGGARVTTRSRRPSDPRSKWPAGGVLVPGFVSDYDPMEPSMDHGTHLDVEALRIAQFAPERRADFREGLRKACSIIETLNAEACAQGASFLLVVIPDEYQVDAELRAAMTSERGITLRDLDLPQRSLVEFCEPRGIPVLDLLPAFQEIGASKKLYRLRDTHWNIEGNALAAKLIAELTVRLLDAPL